MEKINLHGGLRAIIVLVLKRGGSGSQHETIVSQKSTRIASLFFPIFSPASSKLVLEV
jgi:hypothetical protein